PKTGLVDGVENRTSYLMNSLLSHRTRRYGRWNLIRFINEVGTSSFIAFSERNAEVFSVSNGGNPTPGRLRHLARHRHHQPVDRLRPAFRERQLPLPGRSRCIAYVGCGCAGHVSGQDRPDPGRNVSPLMRVCCAALTKRLPERAEAQGRRRPSIKRVPFGHCQPNETPCCPDNESLRGAGQLSTVSENFLPHNAPLHTLPQFFTLDRPRLSGVPTRADVVMRRKWHLLTWPCRAEMASNWHANY